MKIQALALIILVLASMAPAGCQVVDNYASVDLMRKWHLVEVTTENGEIVFKPEDISEYWIQLYPDGEMEGRVGCNSCFGEYNIQENNIQAGMGCTEIACASGVYHRYIQDIYRAQTFETAGLSLYLYSSDFEGNKLILKHLAGTQ